MTSIPSKQKVQIVTIADGQLLLLQFAEIYNQGFQNITGSVDSGETFLEAAMRELQEEIGSRSEIIDLHQNFHFHDRWGSDVHEKVFLCQFKKIPSIILSHEHQSFKWIPTAQVTPLDFVFPSNFEAFQKAMEYLTK